MIIQLQRSVIHFEAQGKLINTYMIIPTTKIMGTMFTDLMTIQRKQNNQLIHLKQSMIQLSPEDIII